MFGIRTDPTSAVTVSVYPDEETAKNATVSRNARKEKIAHRRKSTAMYQGEVTLNGLTIYLQKLQSNLKESFY